MSTRPASGQPEPTSIEKLWEKFDYLARVKQDMIADSSGAKLESRWQVSDDRLIDVFFEPIEREQTRLILLAASTRSQSLHEVRLKAKMLSACLDDEASGPATALTRSLVQDIIEHY